MASGVRCIVLGGMFTGGACAAWLTVQLHIAEGELQSWSTLQLLTAGLFLAAITALAVSLGNASKQQASARSYLDQLARTDPHQLTSDGTSSSGADLPSLPANSPWQATAAALSSAIGQFGERLGQLEQARTSAEIRARRMADENGRMSTILAAFADPILTVDQYGELNFCNKSAQQLFNFEFDPDENRSLSQLVGCEALVELLSDTRQHRGPTERRCELELIDPQSGATRWFSATAQTIVEGTDEAEFGNTGADEASPHGAVAVLRDVSNQKGMQKRNAEFVSSVSHEMKTPLTGIKAYVELLADGAVEDEETREEFLGVIDNQADRLQRLVENLLNIARIEAGVVQVSKQNRSLNELLEEAANVVQPAAQQKDISLELELSSMYLGVHVDRDMFLQGVINLLSNAIKYTPDGGRVTLRSRTHDNQVQVEVEDTGVGLSEEDCQHVFEKFYRVKKDKSMAAGTGLGLPLAKHIVEDVHGGRLDISSTLGVGSTFTITVPSAREMTAAPAMS